MITNIKIFLLIFIFFFSNANSESLKYNLEYLNSDYTFSANINNKSIIVGGFCGNIIKSSDLGLSWSKPNTYSNIGMLGFTSVDSKANSVIAVGHIGFIRYSFDNGDTWNIPDSITNQTLNKVILIDSQTGIAFGNSGIIIKTVNAGRSWVNIVNTINTDIIDALILSDNSIILTTINGKVFKSIDNANNWTELVIDAPAFVPKNFSYTKDGTLYLLTNISLLKSTDNGNTWLVMSRPVMNISYCHFIKDKIGYFVGDKLKIYSTKNDTTINQIMDLDSYLYYANNTTLRHIQFTDDNFGLAVGTNNTIFITRNGGLKWELISNLNGYRSYFSSVFFLNDNYGYIGCLYESVYITSNAGATWYPTPNTKPKGEKFNITKIHFFDKEKGLLASECTSGNILKTFDSNKTYIREDIKEFNGGSGSFNFIDNELFLFRGDKYFNNNFHTYTVIKNLSGDSWNSCVFDSINAGAFVKSPSVMFLFGSYLDSTKLPDLPYMYTSGIILISLDTGKTWKRKYFKNIETINGIIFQDELNGFAYGSFYDQQKKIYITSRYLTSDGGLNWSSADTVFNGLAPTWLKINSKLWIGYNWGRSNLKYTSNSGVSWQDIYINDSFNIIDVFNINNTLYLSGVINTYFPTVMKMVIKDSTVSAIDQKTESDLLGWVFEPYPNPCTNHTNFEIAWDKRYALSDLKIKLYNIKGEEVQSPIYEIDSKTINTGTIKLNTSSLERGLYILQLNIGDFKKEQAVIVN